MEIMPPAMLVNVNEQVIICNPSVALLSLLFAIVIYYSIERELETNQSGEMYRKLDILMRKSLRFEKFTIICKTKLIPCMFHLAWT